jgi:hypothetical protein
VFIKFRSRKDEFTFVLNAFQIIAIHETADDCTCIITTDNERYYSCEKYKDVYEKLESL